MKVLPSNFSGPESSISATPFPIQVIAVFDAQTGRANDIFLRKRRKVLLSLTPTASAQAKQTAGLNHVASVARQLAGLGYIMSAELMEAAGRLSLEELTLFNQSLIATLSRALGSHQKFKPFYPNFPAQVMAMSEAELYTNALLHYLTIGRYRPDGVGTEAFQEHPEQSKAEKTLAAALKKVLDFFSPNEYKASPRPSLSELTKLKLIELGSLSEFQSLFTQLATANTAISAEDRGDMASFIDLYGETIISMLPSHAPNKENRSYLAAQLIMKLNYADFASACCETATDVLRLAAGLSDGDISLAEPCRFKSFKRKHRKMLLQFLEKINDPVEDMMRRQKPWLRLGERLHPGEFEKKFPQAASAFYVVRNDLNEPSFNSKVEKALENANVSKDINPALDLLKSRPGVLSRRLDHLLRTAADTTIIKEFDRVAAKVSTPVLLQIEHHFSVRSENRAIRVFFPKGQTAKAHCEFSALPPLDSGLCQSVVSVCRRTLVERFAALPSLGATWIDPQLAEFTVPFSQRSAAKALHTISRGSRLPLPEGNTLRFFVWWKNGRGRTDIDLSAAIFDGDFSSMATVAYYNLKEFGGHHSGDIVDAPSGASEFIDISKSVLKERGARYVVMVLNSFTQQPYCDLPECFAGWMSRSKPDSGEIYEPKTVENKIDIGANSKICIPAIFDLTENKVIWCDLTLSHYPNWVNNVAGNMRGIQATLKAMALFRRANLYNLLTMHVEARGTFAESKDKAETIFNAQNFPFELERIASEFMA